TIRATSCCTPSAGPARRTAPATPPRSGSPRWWSRSARSRRRSPPSAWRPRTSCWPPRSPIRSSCRSTPRAPSRTSPTWRRRSARGWTGRASGSRPSGLSARSTCGTPCSSPRSPPRSPAARSTPRRSRPPRPPSNSATPPCTARTPASARPASRPSPSGSAGPACCRSPRPCPRSPPPPRHTRRHHRDRGRARQPDHPPRPEEPADHRHRQERVMTMFIPGSEIFSSRPIDPEELRRSLPMRLETHTVRPEKVDELDPLTYEVVRHRLWSVTDGMGEALKRMSGSPIVTDANDFDFAICDELGQEVQVGLYNTMLVGAVDLAIYWTLRHRAANPGIAEGDMFLCNDPWVGGGLHQNDVIVYQPVFHDGKLFAW